LACSVRRPFHNTITRRLLAGKEKTQKKILADIISHFKIVSEKHGIPKGDFPNPDRFRKSLEKFEIHKFPKMKKVGVAPVAPKLTQTYCCLQEVMQAMEEVLTTDMPKLMALVPTTKSVCALFIELL
jgi:hypothetical protein